MDRVYNYQRARCEDKALITEWFAIVYNTKMKYSIYNEDIYNFDKTSFKMGNVSTTIVVISPKRQLRPKQI